MPALRVVTHVSLPEETAAGAVTDLLLVTDGTGTETLHTVTRAGGRLESWSMAGGGLSRIGAVELGGEGFAGDPGSLAAVPLAAGPALLQAGARGTLTLRSLADAAGDPRNIAAPGPGGALADMETVVLPSGLRAVYGGLAGRDGIGALFLDAAGGPAGSRVIPDTGAVHADGVAALAVARAGGETWLVTAGTRDPGVTSWQIAPNGIPVAADHAGTQDGLWIAAPTAMETVTAGGRTYVVLAAAGSSSLSVMELGPDGALRVSDHVIDDRHSRFEGVQALAVAQHRGQAYVISGGADDGITVHLLLPDGRLLQRAILADGQASGLAKVSAIATRSAGDGLDIFVASASEPGLTRLRLDLGPAGAHLRAPASGGTVSGGAGGDLIEGGRGDDRLSGGGGDDILRDGAGEDWLHGRAGADVFVLAEDGAADRILDFEPGRDLLDLSAWPSLRSMAQLFIDPLDGGGLRLRYGDETLDLLPAAGAAITPGMLSDADLFGATHLPPVARPGLPGPLPPPPEPQTVGDGRDDVLTGGRGAQTLEGRGGDDTLRGGGGPDVLLGEGGDDRLFGGRGHDRLSGGTEDDVLKGQAGRDRLTGDLGHDRLFGGGGPDRANGGAGVDLLAGGGGDDRLQGGPGADVLRGGGGDDRLRGGEGDDRLAGRSGGDLLTGDRGADRLAGGGGRDVLKGGSDDDDLAGGGGSDRLLGQRGDDRLSGGGAGRDRLQGGGGPDALFGGKGADRLAGGSGRDMLDGGPGRDRLAGGAGPDIFVFAAGDGHDTIADFQRGETLLLDSGLWSADLGPSQVVARFAERGPEGLVLEFGRDSLTVEGLWGKAALADALDLF